MNTLSDKPIPPAVSPDVPVAKKKPKRIQERIMLVLCLFFLGGFLLLTFFPSGMITGIGMGLLSTGLMVYILRIK